MKRASTVFGLCVGALLAVPENLDADFFDGPHAWSNNKTLAFLERHFGR